VTPPLRLATRGSPLALVQAARVADALTGRHPDLRIETVVVSTRGDREAHVALDRMGGQGVFVKEIQRAVAEGRCDIAVHSAKDLPSETPEGLQFASVPERLDPRDALVGCTLAALEPGARVATGSARRRAQLANLRPDLTFVELRGNMETRLQRATDGSVAAVVVAVAALLRLDAAPLIAEILSPAMLLPQVGQGALALECREGDERVLALLAETDDRDAHREVAAERSFLGSSGVTCTMPVGALARRGPGDRLSLEAMVASGDGRLLVRTTVEGDEPEELGRRAAAAVVANGGAWVMAGSDRGAPGGGP
jgi:hydroxymethylbilane synthase